MEFFNEMPAINEAAANYMLGLDMAELSDELRERLTSATGQVSPVDRIVKTGEVLYAHRDEIDDDGKTLAAQLIAFAALNGFHGLADGRGQAIVSAMRRELGDEHPAGLDWPDPETDPEILDEYKTPELEEIPGEDEPEGEGGGEAPSEGG
jgi:hypothetical protein